MKLSAEQFAELAATFNAKASPTEHDRRRAARMELQANIKITPIHSGNRLSAMHVIVSDFSARGIAFLHATPMPLGQQFITELPRKSGGVVELLCTVAHCSIIGHNAYRVGAEFTCALQTDPKHIPANDPRELQRIKESMLK
ncbi:MAG TPA: PilZ domain-containing protein [Tepidisphaeraceae bacterium]|nr:PilZ domain-containing protein [Tepidisphaeraceae bacterium]